MKPRRPTPPARRRRNAAARTARGLPRLAAAVLLGAWAAGLANGAGVASSAERTGRITVTGARAWAHPGYTRFVLEMSAKVEGRIFTLSTPNRLVIDFPELAFRIPRSPSGARASGPKPVGVIAGYRYGLFKPGTSRVVLDLGGPAGVKRAFVLPPGEGKPYRFVLDLEPVTSQAFAASVRRSLPSGPSPPAREPAFGDMPRAVDGLFAVAIDAGHGGIDPGTIGRNGLYEKDVALAAARELAAKLEALGGFRVVLTRGRDIFLRLRERVAIGRRAGARLFLSLHADSIANAAVRGAHVYSLSETASDKEAAALAAKENKADIIAGVDLADYSPVVGNILLDLMQRETNNFSAEAAGVLVTALGARGLHTLRKAHRQAGFAVLKAPDVPSVLIELGYLSNPRDAAMLASAKARAPLIEAIAGAVQRYARTHPAPRP